MEDRMKVFAINGSPRKNWNTSIVLNKALEGVRKVYPYVQTEIIHLYDMRYTGCVSCFSCKRLNSHSYGRCVLKDDLTELLNEISFADGIILGSPIYFGDVTGAFHSFVERFCFQYYSYDRNNCSIAPKRMPISIIYTMNLSESMLEQCGYLNTIKPLE